MTFLAPIFLLGALAIAGPILFHLIRRNTKDKFTFSSLMFLRPDPPTVTRKSRLEDILLLLLRCAILAALCLAFARPFFRQTVTAANDTTAGTYTILLIDTSASLRRPGAWEAALAKARAELKTVKNTDTLAILTFADTTTSLLRFDQWQKIAEPNRQAAAQQTLDALQPGWDATHFGNALQTATDLLAEAPAGAGLRVVVVTDRQEGSSLKGLQGLDWPENLQLTLHTIEPKTAGNAGLHRAPGRGGDAAGSPRVRVVNSADATREQFRLAWLTEGQNDSTNAVEIYVPAGRSRTFTAPRRPPGDGWRLALLGDEAKFDNELFIAPEAPEPVRIHYVGTERADDTDQMRFYLERVFSKTRTQHVTVLAHEPSGLDAQLAHPDDRLLIITAPVPQPHIARIRAFCESGHSALLVLKDNSLAPTLAALTASGPVPLAEAVVQKYSLLAQLDFEHPVLAPFNEPRFSDFTKIHFWKHRVIDPARLLGAKVVAKFDGGDPALLHLPVGRGNLFVLTSGWHPADSQLALSSKFVPLLYSMMEQGDTRGAFTAANLIGAPIALPGEADKERTVILPDGKSESIPPETGIFHAKTPGLYTLKTTREVPFAVNLSPNESRTDPLPMERLEGLKLPFAKNSKKSAEIVQKREQAIVDERLEKRQKVWRWLILAAILLVLLETFVGGWMWRRPAAETTGKTT